jgi:2-polyprenyl-6-methoxyphenol hydroxylase-like FAD-dependent oxidoreductase
MDARRAVVAGGGLGGLTAAVALHRRGWRVSVLERAASLEPVGAGISLWPNALRALDTVGVGEAARAHALLAGANGVRRPDGRWLARSDVAAGLRARFGDSLVLVHRAELVGMLAEQLPAGSVHTSTTVTGVDVGAVDQPAVVRTDQGELDADVVVAADGIRSVLRGALSPNAAGPRYAGYTAWRLVVDSPSGISTGFETWGRDGQRFAVLPLRGERLYCYATAALPAGGRAADEAAELRARFGGWHDPIPQVLVAATAEQILRQDVEYLPDPPPRYHRGRAVLIGDAAHAMTPDLGQGGGMAIEDAVVLAWSLGQAEPTAALERFTALRRARTAAVARRSYRAGRLYLAPYRLQLLAARAMGLLPAAVLARAVAPIVDWWPPDVGGRA